MADQPKPISAFERGKRFRRISAIGRDLGFVGEIEYRHQSSKSGGAQYCIGPTVDDDIMAVYAKAFERDADPDDYTLDAIIAHEIGHQKVIRDPNVRAVFADYPGEAFEEILASLVGSILLGGTKSSRTLIWKASAELTDMGMSDEDVILFVEELLSILEQLL